MSEPANDNRLGLHFTAVLEATRRAHEQSVAYLEEAERLLASDPSELTRAAVLAAQTSVSTTWAALQALEEAQTTLLSEISAEHLG